MMLMEGLAITLAAVIMAVGQVPTTDLSGTPVELMVMREVTGDHSPPGTEVRLSVNKAFALDGGVIPYGTPAFGEVVEAKPSGMAMRRGAISIKLTRLVIGGRDVPITGDFASRGHGGSGDDATKILFVPIYALFAPGNVGKVKAGQIIAGHLPAGFTFSQSGPLPK